MHKVPSRLSRAAPRPAADPNVQYFWDNKAITLTELYQRPIAEAAYPEAQARFSSRTEARCTRTGGNVPPELFPEYVVRRWDFGSRPVGAFHNHA